MSCVCCIELIHWHPSGLGKLCLTLRSGHRYRLWPPMPVCTKTRCVLSVDVMAGLPTTLKGVMFRLRCVNPLTSETPLNARDSTETRRRRHHEASPALGQTGGGIMLQRDHQPAGRRRGDQGGGKVNTGAEGGHDGLRSLPVRRRSGGSRNVGTTYTGPCRRFTPARRGHGCIRGPAWQRRSRAGKLVVARRGGPDVGVAGLRGILGQRRHPAVRAPLSDAGLPIGGKFSESEISLSGRGSVAKVVGGWAGPRRS